MSYIVGGDIEASDYNQFVYQIKRILTDMNIGAITVNNGVDIGYGKTSTLVDVGISDVVTNEQWSALIDTIKLVGVHQGTDTTPPMPAVLPVSGDDIEVYSSALTFQGLLDLLYANRLNLAVGQSVTIEKINQSYSTAWSDLLEFNFQTDFGTWDNLRHFFNTGGQIVLSGSYSPVLNPSEISLQTLLSAMSPLNISANNAVPANNTTQTPNVGIYNLSASYPQYTTLYRQPFSGTTWDNHGVTVEAKLVDEPGTSGKVLFRVSATDVDGDEKSGTLNYIVSCIKSNGVAAYTGLLDFTFESWAGINTPVPVVMSVNPASGTDLGGNTVEIAGINFINVTNVTFGGIPATGFYVVSDTLINATPPGGTANQTVPVVVYTTGGTSNSTVTYTYTATGTGGGIIATGGVVEDRIIGWRCYRFHTFPDAGSFIVSNIGTYGANVDYLLVGGGGGGGGNTSLGAGGGGGGGGYLTGSTTISVQSYSIVVGDGGTADGSDGSASSAFGVTARGGGGGGRYAGITGRAGASGGGGGQNTSNYRNSSPTYVAGGSNITNFGFPGGTSVMAPGLDAAGGGGGGGAGGTGGNTPPGSYSQSYPSPNNIYTAYVDGGAGGNGIGNNIYGYTISICGGGGGAGAARSTQGQPYNWPAEYRVTTPSGNPGAGGGIYINSEFIRSGGTGARYSSQGGQSGVPNRGGGGGGGQSPAGPGAGGSGVVIARYLKCQPPEFTYDAAFVSARSLLNAVRYAAGAVTLDHKILSIGGVINGTTPDNGSVTNQVNMYTTSANTWTSLAVMPQALHSQAAERLPDGKILVWGGQTSTPTLVSTAYVYNTITNAWTTGTAFPTSIAGAASARLASGDIISIGGYTDLSGTPSNQVYIYRTLTSSWEHVADCPVPVSRASAVAMPSGSVALVYQSSLYFYNPTTNVWSSGPALPANKVSAGAVCTPEGYIGVYGGISSTDTARTPTSTLYIYNPCCNAWGQAANMPIPLYGHRVCLANTGGEVFIFGGVSINGVNVPNLYRQVLKYIPTYAPMIATGGEITEYTTGSVRYKIHTFTSSGTFAVQSLGTTTGAIEYLLVGGGGGGGWTLNHPAGAGGGGGGGGIISGATNVVVNSYSVIVGAGGSTNASGGNSSLGGIVAAGGGYGGTYSPFTASTATPGSGGSGGGAGQSWIDYAYAGGSATVGQGNAGGSTLTGTGPDNAYNGGGGGGGGSGVGASVSRSITGGAGGAGRTNSLRTGSAVYYSGGGGGAGANIALASNGAGGIGGGGAGAVHSGAVNPPASNAVAGTPNTGGGGGGGNGNSGTSNGAPGGSGIVVVRYRITE